MTMTMTLTMTMTMTMMRIRIRIRMRIRMMMIMEGKRQMIMDKENDFVCLFERDSKNLGGFQN